MNNLTLHGANPENLYKALNLVMPEKIIKLSVRPYWNASGNEAEIFDIIMAWNLLDISCSVLAKIIIFLIYYGVNPEKIIELSSQPYLNKSGNEAKNFNHE